MPQIETSKAVSILTRISLFAGLWWIIAQGRTDAWVIGLAAGGSAYQYACAFVFLSAMATGFTRLDTGRRLTVPSDEIGCFNRLKTTGNV